MRKLVLYAVLAGSFGIALLLETLVTTPIGERPSRRLVVRLGGTAPMVVPEQPLPEEEPPAARPIRAPRTKKPEPEPEEPGNGTRIQAPPTLPQFTSVTVEKGDTFWSLAKDHLGSHHRWPELASFNGMKSEDLREGMTVRVPLSTPVSADRPTTTPRTHTVAAGETLSDIAERYLGSSNRWREIQDLNQLKDPKKVPSGAVLRLPNR